MSKSRKLNDDSRENENVDDMQNMVFGEDIPDLPENVVDLHHFFHVAGDLPNVPPVEDTAERSNQNQHNDKPSKYRKLNDGTRETIIYDDIQNIVSGEDFPDLPEHPVDLHHFFYVAGDLPALPSVEGTAEQIERLDIFEADFDINKALPALPDLGLPMQVDFGVPEGEAGIPEEIAQLEHQNDFPEHSPIFPQPASPMQTNDNVAAEQEVAAPMEVDTDVPENNVGNIYEVDEIQPNVGVLGDSSASIAAPAPLSGSSSDRFTCPYCNHVLNSEQAVRHHIGIVSFFSFHQLPSGSKY